MQTKSGTTALVTLAEPGNRDFLHIKNTGDSTIFISYDGLDATVADGMPLDPGDTIELNNDGSKPVFNRKVTAIGTEAWEVKLQGV